MKFNIGDSSAITVAGADKADSQARETLVSRAQNMTEVIMD